MQSQCVLNVLHVCEIKKRCCLFAVLHVFEIKKTCKVIVRSMFSSQLFRKEKQKNKKSNTTS